MWEKYLQNQIMILIVICNVRNSTSHIRTIFQIPLADWPTQIVVCFSPEQPFPIPWKFVIIGLTLSFWFGIMWINNNPGSRNWRHFLGGCAWLRTCDIWIPLFSMRGCHVCICQFPHYILPHDFNMLIRYERGSPQYLYLKTGIWLPC